MINEEIDFFRESKKKNITRLVNNTAVSLLGVIPGAAEVKTALDEYRKYKDEQEALTLTQFFYGIGVDDSDKVKNMIDSLGPEYAEKIINNVISDMESKKIKYYGNMVINISNNKDMNKNERDEIAIILRDMSIFDIELAKRYYLYSNFDIDGFVDRSEQLSSLIDVDNGIQLKSINSLLSNGLVKNIVVWDGVKYEPTKLLNSFIEMTHLENEILPKNIGMKEKENIDIIFGIEKFIFNRGGMVSACNGYVCNLIDSICIWMDYFGITYKVINDQDYSFVKSNVSAKLLIKLIVEDDLSNCYIYRCKDGDDFLSRDDKKIPYDERIALEHVDMNVTDSSVEEIAYNIFEMVI